MDDEEHLADLVATALRYEGFQTATAGTARAALRAVTGFAPDLVVLDVRLPAGSEVEACRALRDRGVDIPVLFLTALDSPADKVAGFTAGGDGPSAPCLRRDRQRDFDTHSERHGGRAADSRRVEHMCECGGSLPT